jgi:hypothetical protein
MRREDSAVKMWRMTYAVEESFKKRETAEVMVYVGGKGMVVVVRCLYMLAAVRIISGKGLQI